MIITFYSYKGGVGRSMALANVARWFQLQGLRAVMVDWDLEAPGLESFFGSDEAERDALRSRLGLLDLIVAYKEILPSLPRAADLVSRTNDERARAADGVGPSVEMLENALPPLAHMLVPIKLPAPNNAGKLWLLPAGCRSQTRFSTYAETVQRFDWEEFYANYAGEAYFEWMRRQLLSPEVADVVLIDSRTGVAEMSGVCTRQLADVVVVFCAPNDQNLDGVEMMAKSFARDDVKAARGDRPIQLVMVPARIDVSEGRPVDLFEQRFRNKLERFLPDAFGRVNTSFAKLRVPYISAYAYSERLAIGDLEGVRSLQDAYVMLGAHLALLAPAESALKRQCREALQQAFGLPTVFITHLDESEAGFAADLRTKLDRVGVITALTQDKPDVVIETALRSRGTPGSSASVLLAVGRGGLGDDRLRGLWRRGREQGLSLFLVTPEASVRGIGSQPRWAQRARLIDASAEWDELVRLLQTPFQAPRVPFLAPPLGGRFVGRSVEIQAVKRLLLEAEKKTGEARPIALVGLGGIGKTEIAAAVCHDDDVIEHFEDGILWATLGSEPDLAKVVSGFVVALSGEAGATGSPEEAERKLAELLSGKRCLIVLDDVTEARQLQRQLRGGPGCRLLITSRMLNIAVEAGATVTEIRPLTEDFARQVITADIDPTSLDGELVEQLGRELGQVPLALEIANRAIRTRVKQGDSPAEVLADYVHRLTEEGVVALDSGVSQDAKTSIVASLMLAVERLEPADRMQLPRLAVLPSGRPLDLEEVARAVGGGLTEAEEMVRRLAASSMLSFDSKTRTVQLPALVTAFFKSLELRQRRAEATRVAADRATTGRIFVSYRRDDAAAFAGRIYDRLSQHFGYDRVFMDIETISPGEDFINALENQIVASSAVVVLIGRSWAHRLADPTDFVRTEIAAAFAHGAPIIPVLVDGASMPAESDLPPQIAALARRNALGISSSRFHQDLDRLIQSLERLAGDAAARRVASGTTAAPPPSGRADAVLKASARRSRPLFMVSAGVVALLLAATVGTFYIFRASVPFASSNPQAVALFEKAQDYYFGRGVAQDYSKAAELYRQAAELGLASAQNSLGTMYENGQGVSQDTSEATRWYERAAMQGTQEAQIALKRLLKGRATP